MTVVLALSACTVGPDYARPTSPIPVAYKEIEGWKQATPRDDEAKGAWWEMYGDPVLSALMREVSLSNQELAQAEARYRQARALVAQARSGYYPTLGASASISRAQAARGAGVTQATTVGGGPRMQHEIALDAAWEPDLWGRVRRSVEASEAVEKANVAEVENVRLLLQAQLAQSYFLLRGLEAQQQLYADTVRAFEDSLKLTQNRYNAGVIARADVVQAETQLRSTQAQAVDLGVTRAQLEHAIAVLTGKPPAEFTLARAPLAAAPPTIPVGLPSELLERRPDVAAAERRVESANAQIGVARAAYFPALPLSAAIGFQSATLGNLISTPARFWSLGATLAQALFDGGLRQSETDRAVALYDETVAAYRQTVLIAVQEVEDNLSTLRILEQESEIQADAAALARRSLELTLNQYKAGIVSFLNVLLAQTTQLAAERTLVELRSRRMVASVALVRALGGGWY